MPPAAGSERRESASRFFLERPSNDLLNPSGAVTIRGFRAFIMADVACTKRRSRAIMSCLSSSVHPDWSLGFDGFDPGENLPRRRLGVGRTIFGRPGLRLARPGTITSYTQYPSSRPSRQAGAVRAGPSCRRRRTLPGRLSCRQGIGPSRRGRPECPDCSPHGPGDEGCGCLCGVDAGKDEVFLQLAHMQPFRSALAIRSRTESWLDRTLMGAVPCGLLGPRARAHAPIGSWPKREVGADASSSS